MLRPERWRAAWLLLATLLPACASGEQYARDRLMDLTDVVDFKYGDAWGFGIKFEASIYLGTGIGLGVIEHSREWYGRRATEFTLNKQGDALDWLEGTFAHAGVVGADGGSPGNTMQSAIYTIFFNVLLLSGDETVPPMIDRWRLGGEILLPHVIAGVYLNLGELWDFFAGLGGADPAADDGVRKYVIERP